MFYSSLSFVIATFVTVITHRQIVGTNRRPTVAVRCTALVRPVSVTQSTFNFTQTLTIVT